MFQQVIGAWGGGTIWGVFIGCVKFLLLFVYQYAVGVIDNLVIKQLPCRPVQLGGLVLDEGSDRQPVDVQFVGNHDDGLFDQVHVVFQVIHVELFFILGVSVPTELLVGVFVGVVYLFVKRHGLLVSGQMFLGNIQLFKIGDGLVQLVIVSVINVW